MFWLNLEHQFPLMPLWTCWPVGAGVGGNWPRASCGSHLSLEQYLPSAKGRRTSSAERVAVRPNITFKATYL